MQGNIIKNFLKNIEKMLAFRKNVLYNQTCCDMIALKRRLLYRIDTGFSWSECQLTITGDKSLYEIITAAEMQ